MADQANIFNGETQAPEVTTEGTTETTTSTETDPLSEYVGEGKQFATTGDLVNSFKAKQSHIETLETENKSFREASENRQSVEELIEELKQTKQPDVVKQPEVDLNVIDKLIDSRMSAKEQAAAAAANTRNVVTAMTEKFGEKAESVYNEVGNKIGMSIESLNALAAQSPQAVMKLVDSVVIAEKTPSTSSGSVNTETMQQNEVKAPSARVPVGASTKDMVEAFRAAKPLE